MELSVDEAVTERVVPLHKTWETNGSPKLLVVGRYRMGFDLEKRPDGALLRVFIDYALPDATWGRWLGKLFGRYYAQWCTRQMVHDAVKYFASHA